MKRKKRSKPEGGAIGRLKKPQAALDASEWRWACDGSTKRANPSPYNTNALLGLSAIAVSYLWSLWERENSVSIFIPSFCYFGRRGLEIFVHVSYAQILTAIKHPLQRDCESLFTYLFVITRQQKSRSPWQLVLLDLVFFFFLIIFYVYTLINYTYYHK